MFMRIKETIIKNNENLSKKLAVVGTVLSPIAIPGLKILENRTFLSQLSMQNTLAICGFGLLALSIIVLIISNFIESIKC